MRKSITNRNVLFGIFALQNGFISKESLVTARKTWVLNKHKPMRQILREQDALETDTLALLEALVQKDLAMHGNDAGKESCCGQFPGRRVLDELQQVSDSDVQKSLAHAASDATIDLVPETKVSVGVSSSKGLRFRILRPHAKGGLGLVYVAHDEELNRDVALKEIQDRHADHPESRSRFMLEAEITGGLEHPGIVPVYGLGQYADGRPFYAMRFIRGDSLKEAIAKFHADGRPWREKSLELRELLERLIDVCNALQYAHDRGVLHRDLKPGNIMLGQYGETLVVDWGLAKPLGAQSRKARPCRADVASASGSGSTGTMQDSAVGTPQYMSPGKPPAPWINSARRHPQPRPTLYGGCAGRSPFETSKDAGAKADLGVLLQRVRRAIFPRPRSQRGD